MEYPLLPAQAWAPEALPVTPRSPWARLWRAGRRPLRRRCPVPRGRTCRPEGPGRTGPPHPAFASPASPARFSNTSGPLYARLQNRAREGPGPGCCEGHRGPRVRGSVSRPLSAPAPRSAETAAACLHLAASGGSVRWRWVLCPPGGTSAQVRPRERD